MNESKKELINEYKQRKVVGGVFRVVNTKNGKFLLDYATDLQAKQNSFNFMVTTNASFDYKMDKDWKEFGAQAFRFEVLDSLEKKKDQSQKEFIEDLKTLKGMWGEKVVGTEY
ncbi:GIY-YIG nuclease family protein [Dehalogenimonas etheniformans]|uniref:ArsR family transcriptional regulator n=1 Tax=Dehalogenimonas etheniformans TaxID=1536648 RepID=A0A2P5P592_9CHLR|nr:GIY-YIG nuclease family protein [Dehalogenimonas etheniformans]PPD57469.1 ArsR family transcriptional regulator [Dehalogenimonas etheniformans]QNT76832.1 GIY-YIG nuclease family protein [Dehalogenimonas etheniformans]